MTTSEREVVAALGQAIARRIEEPRYNLWFNGKTKFTFTDSQLVVGVPNHFFQEWLEKKFGDVVRAEAGMLLGEPVPVRYVIEPELFQAARRVQDDVSRRGVDTETSQNSVAAAGVARARDADEREATATQVVDELRPIRPRNERVARHRRWHRLSDFVVGPSNRLAHASALSAVEAPGQCANPLVLHGPVGTGKTHLLEGIYAGLRRGHAEWRVCFVSSEDFTNRFLQAMRLGKLGAFRKHFRECDALLIDDLNFLAGKKATQEEFLHTFDALQADGRQLVATCDSHPKLAGDFSPELTDRLLGGAVWGLQPPDAETRLSILRGKAGKGEGLVPEEVLKHLAGQLRGNVRELEGALCSVRHYARVAGRPVDLNLAREALGDLFRHSVRVVQLGDIDRAVCRALRLEDGALQAKPRNWAISHPRMLAMFLARKHTAAAYSEIGQFFGKRTHSTVVAAEKKIRQWLAEDALFALGERRLHVREVVELAERELLR